MDQLDQTEDAQPNSYLDEPTQEEIDKYFKPKPYVQETNYDRSLNIPKYLPDVDGNPWKTYPYPEVEEFDSVEIPPPEITLPPGLKLDGLDIDSETLDFKHFGYINSILDWLGYILIVCNTYKIIKYCFLWANEKYKEISAEMVPGDEKYTSSEGE